MPFTEYHLRADLVHMWGAYGAHVDVFDRIMERNETLEHENRENLAELETLQQALREIRADIVHTRNGNDLVWDMAAADAAKLIDSALADCGAK